MKNPIQIWTGKKCIKRRKYRFNNTNFYMRGFQIVLDFLKINIFNQIKPFLFPVN